jgi:hypothetical protein
MTVRTWRQGNSLMASAPDAPLDAATLEIVSAHARKRWPWIPEGPGMLLAEDLDDDTRALVRERPELVADLRQVDGLADGWAIAWIDPDSVDLGTPSGNDR